VAPSAGPITARPRATSFTNSQRLSDYGRKIVRRHGRLAVKLTFRIINGSGVTNKRVLSGVIKPE